MTGRSSNEQQRRRRAATGAKQHPCALCGKPDVAERMVFSTHTGQRYCRDLDACDKRRKRQNRSRG